MAYLHWQYRMAHDKTAEELATFHTRVDRLAMLICEELGLDPWQHIGVEENTVECTPYETKWVSYYAPPRELPRLPYVTLPHGELSGGKECVVTMPYAPEPTPHVRAVSVPRWRTFRRQAALQIAGHKALTKYLLTEA